MTTPRIACGGLGPMDDEALQSAADRLAECLRGSGVRIVFAESCTGGLASAALAGVPGISEFHCGSAVVYRIPTKEAWLDVPSDILQDPGPVSAEAAQAMAEGVLRRTAEADVSAAITGHLGPQAPADHDGLVFVGVARRRRDAEGADVDCQVQKVWLQAGMPEEGTDREKRRARLERQREAAVLLLTCAASVLEGQGIS